MISIILTAYKEDKTVGRAIESILSNSLSEDYEILVVAPDELTLRATDKYLKNKNIKAIQDKGAGKPAALNLAVKKARGEILVLTDGDVYIGNNALKPLLDPLKSSEIGAVSGRPISLNSKNTRYGFWAYVLTATAHERRLKATRLNKRFFCSGYLFAIRKELFPQLPTELLSEDGFVSHEVYKKKYKIAYSPDSFVYVKYPTNFNDWIIQKKRSAGGYNQIKKINGVEMRSFKKESQGAFGLFKYVSTINEFFWMALLFFSRVYLWLVIYRDINIKKKLHSEIWKRVESTK